MIRMTRLACGLVLLAGIVILVGCDVPNLAPDDTEEIDPGMWYGRPIKQWILDKNDEDLKDNAKAYLDLVGPEDKDLVPALIPLLKDEDPVVRRGAVKLLGQIGPNAKEALEPLEDSITDPDKMVLKETLVARKRIMGLAP